MYSMKNFLSILFFAVITLTASAQGGRVVLRPGGMGGVGGSIGDQSKGYIMGSVVLSPDTPDGEEIPGAGVMVLVKFNSKATGKADSLYTVVGEKGYFFVRDIPVGKAYVSFDMLGYKREAKAIDINPGENKIIANLQPESIMLNQAVIKESVPPITIVGDTLVFNPAAVKVNKGEMAIDVLEQMPGVEITENGVTILNEKLQHVYVDGALLFGNAPMKALEQLPAEEVLKMRSYQEYANKDPNHTIKETESKQRVLDIQTKSKPTFVISGDVLAGAGFDTDSTYRKFRYVASARVGFSSESLQAEIAASINNINNASAVRRSVVMVGGSQRGGGSSPDFRKINVSASLTKKWMSKTTKNFVLGQLGGSYSFSHDYNVNDSHSSTDYFATEEYLVRRSESLTHSETRNGTHSFRVNAQKSIKDGLLSLDGRFNLGNNSSERLSRTANFQDALPVQGTSSANNSKGKSYSGSVDFNFTKGIKDRYHLGLQASYTGSRNNDLSSRIDTTLSTLTVKYLDITGIGNNHDFSVNPSFKFDINDRQTLSFNYTYSNSLSHTLRNAFDTSGETPIEDPVNTRNLTYDDNRHSLSLGYTNYIKVLDANLSLKGGVIRTAANRNDAYPVSDIINRSFWAPRFSLSFANNKMINKWAFYFESYNSTPALEQLSPRLDNTNLYNVSVGNPDLKQTMFYTFDFSYSTVVGKSRSGMENKSMESVVMEHIMERKAARESGKSTSGRGQGSLDKLNTIMFSLNFTIHQNPSVYKRTYFSKETYLPQYDYTMPAQSTLTTFENVKEGYDGRFSFLSQTVLSKIACNLSLSAGLSFDSSPSFVGTELVRTNNVSPNVRIGLRSNFSKIVRFNVGFTAAYTHSDNTQGFRNDYFNERISASVEVNNIFKHMYIGANYDKVFTQMVKYSGINDNILNATLGAKFGPKNEYTIAFTANDIFNRNTGFSTRMTADYVTNSWTKNFGRYLLFTFAYRFNTMNKK